MFDFVFNSASLPLYDKEMSTDILDMLFTTLSEYIGDNSMPLMYFDNDKKKIFLYNEHSIQNYIDDLPFRERELADFVFEYMERFRDICADDVNTSSLVKVGDDTRFEKNISLKFACASNYILFSVADLLIWKRNKVTITMIYARQKNKTYDIYNLFSNGTDYLPLEKPPFSLDDKRRFSKTNMIHEKQAIYREIGTGYYWYNDYFHKDNKAHFEVFDAQGLHLGEASMEGILDLSKRDARKRIRV